MNICLSISCFATRTRNASISAQTGQQSMGCEIWETELVFDCDEVAAEMHISLVRYEQEIENDVS